MKVSSDQQSQKSKFHCYRQKYQPKAPKILNQINLQGVSSEAEALPEIRQIFPFLNQKGIQSLSFKAGKQTDNIPHALRVGCVLSGGQAAGGHNVIVGIYDYIKRKHKNSQLFGFLNGPKGIYQGKYAEINDQMISYFKNRGGFDMICSGRDKIQTEENKSKSLKYCESLKLDGLVVIGGDDSNTNAAILAEYFLQKGSLIKVVGCPKTIDGDLKNQFVQVSFGFDTACKTYSECIGSVMADTLSSKKYYHFIRLMGRSASHIALECALLTRPTYTFIGEEVQKKKQTLKQLVAKLVQIIVQRSKNKKQYGVVLIPQGLIEFIPEMNTLIKQINGLLAKNKTQGEQIPLQKAKSILDNGLTIESQKLYGFLPKQIKDQLLLDRDPHGNVQVAKIQTQKFIIDLVKRQLKIQPLFKGKFSPLANYFGYEGRCAFPTNFDCDYCYSLGLNAGAIIEAGYTGMMSCIRGLDKQPQLWLPGGYPLVTMMNIELRKNHHVPVIKKALVQLQGPLFKLYQSKRQQWALGQFFNLVGPVQYQFPNPRPYLAVPPTEKQLYIEVPSKKYKQGQEPFAKINEQNLNLLSFDLQKQIPQCPQILNGSNRLITSEQLKFQTKQLKVAVQRQYQFLSKQGHQMITFKKQSESNSKLKQKVKVGVSFNGRQCPGGHNIILGLLDQNVEVIGFLGGTKGIYNQQFININYDNIQHYINSSGFHLLGRTNDKLRTKQQHQKTKQICGKLKLKGLVLIGASHTMTDAVSLTDYFIKNGVQTNVICVPSSIDNNIYHQNLQMSVGFSTSSHMYSTLISNLMIDASSNTKYWYFIRLMGRDPSHLTLQCALSTHPNYTIISEQVQNRGWDIEQLVEDIVRVILRRHQKKLNFGCILIPEGLPTFLPSIVRIKNQIDQIKSQNQNQVKQKMSVWAREKFQKLPDFIRKQLFCRDQDNSLAFSQIQTQKMLACLVDKRLNELKKQGLHKISFAPVCHFFGYQGRCAIPNRIDQNISYTYGRIAKNLIQNNLTGFCPSVRGLTRPAKDWFPLAIPFTHMLQIKENSKFGLNKPIIKSANVNLKSSSFKYFIQNSHKWELTDHYQSPGPIQYYGQMRDYLPLTISLEERYDLDVVDNIQKKLNDLKSKCKFGTDTKYLKVIHSSLNNLFQTLQIMEQDES